MFHNLNLSRRCEVALIVVGHASYVLGGWRLAPKTYKAVFCWQSVPG